MKKKQIVLYIAIFIAAVLAMLGIAYGIHSGIRASNLADIEWYDVNAKEFVIKTENLPANKASDHRTSQENSIKHVKKNLHLSFSNYSTNLKRREQSQIHSTRPPLSP